MNILVVQNKGSAGAKALAAALGAKLSNTPVKVAEYGQRMLGNKLEQLYAFTEAGLPTPQYTESKATALEWVQSGRRVYCRTLLNSSSGKGIVIASAPDEIVDAPLYTLDTRAKKEFRLHMLDGEVFLIQQKMKRRDVEHNPRIKNLAGGYVYVRQEFAGPDIATILGNIKNSGVQYTGAIDVMWNAAKQQAYFLEINSTPGLKNKATLDAWVMALKRKYGLD